MLKRAPNNPFHTGELNAQTRAGVGDVAKWAGGFIRDYLPAQHREFHTSLPFLVVSGGDRDGQTWVTLIDGPDGFAKSPDPRTITLKADIDVTDPLATTFDNGADIGVLGIELATRRRNRFSGYMARSSEGFTIDIRQTFGNCPQYIHERAWTRAPKIKDATAKRDSALTADQIVTIESADTMFIGSSHHGEAGTASNGYDASHRGGAPGFVQVLDATHLQIPDYAGNNFFNTIGNIISNPHVGLLFIDFETGNLLHISGRATVDWNPSETQHQNALRVIDIEIDTVLDRPGAVGLRWRNQDHLARRLKLVRREDETHNITSFYFQAADEQPLEAFIAGQHLPIAVQISGQPGISKRSYSLSSPPSQTDLYRLSIKRENKGLVSRYLHDELHIGSFIEARKPSGNFVLPCNSCPLVLVGAGVGLTPMLSMLHANSQQRKHPVWYVYGVRNGHDHAFRNEVDRLVSSNNNLKQRIFYSQPGSEDVLGRDYNVKGRITAEQLLALKAGSEARYMLCGPAAFLADIRNGLETAGVPTDQIHIETFGPAG